MELDRRTTGKGHTAQEPDCQNLYSTSCVTPSTDCLYFTPPQVYYIRVLASKANSFFTRASAKLTTTALSDLLKIPDIINDFSPPGQSPVDLSLMRTVSGAASVADKIIKGASALGPVADMVGMIGGIMNIVSSTLTDPQDTINMDAIQQAITNQLSTFFDKTQQQIDDLCKKLFGDPNSKYDLKGLVEKTGSFPGISVGHSDWDPIARVFSSGGFLSTSAIDHFDSAFDGAMTQVRQGLISTILTSMDYYVYVDTSGGPCGWTGSRVIDGGCFMVYSRVFPTTFGSDYQQIMPAKAIILLDTKYGIDVVDFYKNIRDCNNGKPSNDINPSYVGNYPKCFFNLPYFEYKSPNVCQVYWDGKTGSLPAGVADKLQLNNKGCNQYLPDPLGCPSCP